MNTPVSFELAQLLKENGFCSKVRSMYCEERLHFDMRTKGNFNDVNWVRTWRSSPDDDTLSAPTIAEVVMWLYEKHGIWISVDCDCYGILWYANLSVASEKNWDNIDLRHEIISASKKFPNEHNSPTETYEAAIEYCLTKLI